jgi:hypothetical protein
VRQQAGGSAETAPQIEHAGARRDPRLASETDDGGGAADVVLVGDLRPLIHREIDLGHSLDRPALPPHAGQDVRHPQRMPIVEARDFAG